MKKSVALLTLGLVTLSCRTNSLDAPPVQPPVQLEPAPASNDEVTLTPTPTTTEERASQRLDSEIVDLVRELYPDTGMPEDEEQRAHRFYKVRRIATAPPGAPTVDAVEVSRRPAQGGPPESEVLFLDEAGDVIARTQVATPVSEHVLRVWGTQVNLGDAEHMLRLRAGDPEPLAVSAVLQYAGAIVVSRLRHVNDGQGWESWHLPDEVSDDLRLFGIETEGNPDGDASQLPAPPFPFRLLTPRITDLTVSLHSIPGTDISVTLWEGAVRVQVLSEDGAELGVLRVLAEGRMP